MSFSFGDLEVLVRDHMQSVGLVSPDVISPDTRLVRDLGLGSVDFVVVFERIRDRCKKSINFIDLIMPDRASYVEDLSLGEILRFLEHAGSADIRSESIILSDPYATQRHRISEADINQLQKAIRTPSYPTETLRTRVRICFLLSAPRSGSTLLRRMLGCHPRIFAPMELHLMTYENYAQRQQELGDEDHAHLLEGTIAARQEVRGMSRELSAAVDRLYARDRRSVLQFYREIDRYLDADVLIDKSPTYAFNPATLQRLLACVPEACFIHLIRRPNAVIKSMIDARVGLQIRFAETSGLSTDRFPEALWCLCEHNIRTALSAVPQRCLTLQYEDLVARPQESMERVQDFLGVERSSLFDPYLHSAADTPEAVERYAGDLKTFLRRRVDAGAAEEWKRFPSLTWLSPPTEALIEAG